MLSTDQKIPLEGGWLSICRRNKWRKPLLEALGGVKVRESTGGYLKKVPLI